MFGILKKTTFALGAVLALGLSVGAASAATCPAFPQVIDRVFTVDQATSCHAYGNGNFDNTYDETLLLPSVLLDKTDEGNASGVVISYTQSVTATPKGWEGSFNILVPVGMKIVDMFLALKTGVAQIDPDWALFTLADNTLSGTWSIDNTADRRNANVALSHMNVYGRLVPAAVPVPAAGFLLIGALGGLAALRRRKKA